MLLHKKVSFFWAAQLQDFRASQYMLLIVMWMDSDGEKIRSYLSDWVVIKACENTHLKKNIEYWMKILIGLQSNESILGKCM